MVVMLIVEQMRLLKMFDCRRPFGAFVTGYGDPRADARGYLPSPFHGWRCITLRVSPDFIGRIRPIRPIRPINTGYVTVQRSNNRLRNCNGAKRALSGPAC